MREIVRAYGVAALAVICVGAVLYFILRGMTTAQGAVGIYEVLEEFFSAPDQAAGETAGREALRIAAEGPLNINGAAVSAGRQYAVDEVMLAENEESEIQTMRIKRILRKGTEQEMTDQIYDQKTGQLRFDEPGIYVFQIYASDTAGAAVSGDVYVNVN